MISTAYNTTDNYQNMPASALVEYSTDKFFTDLLFKKEKLQELKNDIGDDLYNALSEEDKNFILKTEGIVDFGYKITTSNSHGIEEALREDYE